MLSITRHYITVKSDWSFVSLKVPAQSRCDDHTCTNKISLHISSEDGDGVAKPEILTNCKHIEHTVIMNY
jgi:hypothetical protein